MDTPSLEGRVLFSQSAHCLGFVKWVEQETVPVQPRPGTFHPPVSVVSPWWARPKQSPDWAPGNPSASGHGHATWAALMRAREFRYSKWHVWIPHDSCADGIDMTMNVLWIIGAIWSVAFCRWTHFSSMAVLDKSPGWLGWPGWPGWPGWLAPMIHRLSLHLQGLKHNGCHGLLKHVMLL